MKILRKGKKNGRTFILGKFTHSEEDLLNTEKSFNDALATLNSIRKEAELIQYGKIPEFNRSIYGKRKAC
ncbi:MAG: hypothetical protein LHV68_05440 [Elusimicrobia bacterium]|nr:hypothetical protein [Candidatus Liberimonas magnetica]